MIEKLTHVPIVVSDQEKALKFYTEVLGFEKRADYRNPGSPRWLTVAPKGTDVELILFEGKYKIDPRAPPEAGSGGNHFVFRTNDCRKDFEIFKARGLKFKDPAPVEANYGSMPTCARTEARSARRPPRNSRPASSTTKSSSWTTCSCTGSQASRARTATR